MLSGFARVGCEDMGRSASLRLAVLRLCLLLGLAALAGSAVATAGILPEKVERADLSTTGDRSELVESVPISTVAGGDERVVMSLGPDQLPRLANGDRLEIGGEVQVSTTCVVPGTRCVGSSYDFNPTIQARLALAPSADPAAASIPLSEPKQVLCKQRRPQRNHHCTLTFSTTQFAVGDVATLPCADNACYVNMILGASNRRAESGNLVVLGADRPDGSVKGDKGRLNVVHSRAETPGPTESSSSTLVTPFLQLNEGKLVKRRVIHSVEIPAPRKGEVLAADGNYLATIDELPFNTFLSNRIIVAETPTSVEPTGVAKAASQLRGDLTESNGFNCTQGASGYATPCTTTKAGALRITRDALDANGQPVPLYVNLVASAKPLLYPAQRLKRFHKVAVTPTTGLRVLRYTPPAG